jgi:tRNA (guanine37-N1)-methyltransferase
MIRIDVVTGFPQIILGPIGESMVRRAQDQGQADIAVHDLRDFTTDRHKTIDDAPFGGGAGMILKPAPVFACIESLQRERTYDEIIYLTADGEPLTQALANALSLTSALLFLCGHYKGVDERIRTSLITREVSIGDYVLTGGELPALVLIDAIVRLLPGVMHDGTSLLGDSFQDGLLDAPYYTRPADFRGMKVPAVLLSGNHEEISRWRDEQRRERTQRRRQDLLIRTRDDEEYHHG